MSSASARAVRSRPRVARIELFRLLADQARLQILALCEEEELSVGELALLLKDSQPQISRKVGPLKQAGLLDARREGTRTFLKVRAAGTADPVIADAMQEGRRLCLEDGSLARVPEVIVAREESGRALFDVTAAAQPAPAAELASPASLAHLSALSLLLPGRSLAVDVGTGEGMLLDVLAPLYGRVIAVDRSPAQLASCARRVAARGFTNVSLFQGSFEDVSLLERVEAAGGADLVYASRTLHHASRPAQAIKGFGRLLKRGGHLVLLDYLPHADDTMRERHGDAWLGFAPRELRSHLEAAALQVVGESSVPAAFHREGHDAHLDWHVIVARRPTVSG